MRCIRSRNTFPGFFPLGFYPGFSYRATYRRYIFRRFFPSFLLCEFFLLCTALALNFFFFDYGYLYNTFRLDRYISMYIFQAIVNYIRTCTVMFMYCQYGFSSSFTV